MKEHNGANLIRQEKEFENGPDQCGGCGEKHCFPHAYMKGVWAAA